jgi:hypothetical protein
MSFALYLLIVSGIGLLLAAVNEVRQDLKVSHGSSLHLNQIEKETA